MSPVTVVQLLSYLFIHIFYGFITRLSHTNTGPCATFLFCVALMEDEESRNTGEATSSTTDNQESFTELPQEDNNYNAVHQSAQKESLHEADSETDYESTNGHSKIVPLDYEEVSIYEDETFDDADAYDERGHLKSIQSFDSLNEGDNSEIDKRSSSPKQSLYMLYASSLLSAWSDR